jgi:hypothetical protein
MARLARQPQPAKTMNRSIGDALLQALRMRYLRQSLNQQRR